MSRSNRTPRTRTRVHKDRRLALQADIDRLEIDFARLPTCPNAGTPIARDSVTSFRLLAADLGMTPTARARLSIAEPPELSELDRLLGYHEDD